MDIPTVTKIITMTSGLQTLCKLSLDKEYFWCGKYCPKSKVIFLGAPVFKLCRGWLDWDFKLVIQTDLIGFEIDFRDEIWWGLGYCFTETCPFVKSRETFFHD